MKILLSFIFLAAYFWPSAALAGPAPQESAPVVRAILFYSPSCGHCHHVITETLPPLFEQYGEQLAMVGVDITTQEGAALFGSALQYFGLERGGVPFLVVGDTYLFGSVDIPEQFPGVIDYYLVQGGVDWPEIPGVAEAMAASATAQAAAATPMPATEPAFTPTTTSQIGKETPVPAETATQTGLILNTNSYASPWERLERDRLGNGLALVVLVGMLLSLVAMVFYFQRLTMTQPAGSRSWAIPILCIIGLGVAGYLAYVETSQVQAVCGPVGDCNTVQQSEYARLFGVLPIGVLGLVGYILILLAWMVNQYARSKAAAYAALALFGMTVFGLLFSIYLTFLEPFVIGATCAWCLTSAVLMTALFWLSVKPVRTALSHLFTEKKYAHNRSSSQRAL